MTGDAGGGAGGSAARRQFRWLPSNHVALPLDRIGEYPLLAECLRVWRRDAVGRLPSTIDPLELPVAVIKGISLFRRDPASGDWQVWLAGSLLTEGHGREMRGTGLADGIPPDDLPVVRRDIERAMARGEPDLVRREFQDPNDRWWSFVRLLLPLSSDGTARDRYAMIIDPPTFGRPGTP